MHGAGIEIIGVVWLPGRSSMFACS